MKILFNYVGIKVDSGKCRLLTGLDSVMLNNLITYVRDFCEEHPNFVLLQRRSTNHYVDKTVTQSYIRTFGAYW